MKFVAITSCPAGIAHTYMAAEKLAVAAQEMGHEMKVETQGSVGAENVITPEDLKDVRAVIIAADCKVDLSRFTGLPILEASVQEAIKDSKALIQRAMELKKPAASAVDAVLDAKANASAQRTGIYKHLMTGVSYMLPFVVTGGILVALGFLFGGIYMEGAFASALGQLKDLAMGYMVPIMAAYIAYSIADRPGIVPGMVGGGVASAIGAGFLGGIIAGLLAGYVAYLIKRYLKLPKALQSLMPILIIPLLSTFIVGMIMIFVLGDPVAALNTAMTNWLTNLSSVGGVAIGLVLGAMMAFDMGGPVNKAAYVFATGTLAAGAASPVMAATMAAGMTPPIGIAIATFVMKKLFNEDEREAGKVALVMGAAFVTEGAIPFAAADPLRIIPSCMIGSAVASALSMLFGCALSVPHGGIFVLAIPGAIDGLLPYLAAVIIGSVVTALLVILLKKGKKAA